MEFPRHEIDGEVFLQLEPGELSPLTTWGCSLPLLGGAALLGWYYLAHNDGLAAFGAVVMLAVVILVLLARPTPVKALGRDAVYELSWKDRRLRVSSRLASRDAIRGVAPVPRTLHRDGDGDLPGWGAGLCVDGLPPIPLRPPGPDREVALQEARQAAEALGLPCLTEAPAEKTLAPRGNGLVVLEYTSWVEWLLEALAVCSPLVAVLPLVTWFSLGMGNREWLIAGLALLALSPLAYFLRGRLDDFLVLDLPSGRLLTIRRLLGRDWQRVAASFPEVLETALLARWGAGSKRRGGGRNRELFYTPVLALRSGRFLGLGNSTRDPVEAAARAEEVSRLIGCPYAAPPSEPVSRRFERGQLTFGPPGPTWSVLLLKNAVLWISAVLMLGMLYAMARMVFP